MSHHTRSWSDKTSDYNQEMPHSPITDQHMALRKKDTIKQVIKHTHYRGSGWEGLVFTFH